MYIDKDIINIVENTIKDFIWNGKKTKIKNSTLYAEYSEGGLKLPDFQSQLKAMNISTIIKLIDGHHKGKFFTLIPDTYLVSLGGFSQISSNFDPTNIHKQTPAFLRQLLQTWSDYAFSNSEIDLDCVMNQNIWNNKYIKVDGLPIYYKNFAQKGIQKIRNLCDDDGTFCWNYAKILGLKDKDFLKWAGIIHALPNDWKKLISEQRERIPAIKQKDVKMYIKRKEVKLDQLTSKVIYQELVKERITKPTAQSNLIRRFGIDQPDWEKIYNRIYATTIDNYLRMFQFKILNNILYLNYDLNRFKIIDCSSCSFCHSYPETIEHLFVQCIETKNLYFEIRDWIKSFGILLPSCNNENIIFGVDDQLINFILLVYKLILFKTRNKSNIVLSISIFKNTLKLYKTIEWKVALNKQKVEIHNKKKERLEKL